MTKRRAIEIKKPDQAGFLRSLLLATSIMVFLLIVLGGIVRVTESGGTCPDWPTCFGQFIPPVGTNALLDYSHRLVTLLAGVLLVASLIVSRRMQPGAALIRRPLAAA